jgi:hypothetical protein
VIVGSHDSDYKHYRLPGRNNFYSRIQTLCLGTISSFHFQGTKSPECGGGRFVRHIQVYFTDYKRKFPEDSKGYRQEAARPPDFTHADLQNMYEIQFEKFRKATISFVMFVRPSVRMEKLSYHRTDIITFDSCVFFENLSIKLKFHSNLTRVTCTFHEDVSTFRPMIISRSMLFRMRNVSDKIIEKIKTDFTFFLVANEI